MADDRHDGRFATVGEAADALRRGLFVIIVDDEDRENEGDLAIAAEKVTPEAINFLATEARGLICVALTEQRCDELQLQPMVEHNTSTHGTAFCVSVEARQQVTTGISAADRATTVRALLDLVTRPGDLARPGHMVPLRARNGGVLKRAGHTEASVDLALLAGLVPAAVICEVMDRDGSMARLPRLFELAREHGLEVVSVRDLIAHRMRTERLVERIATASLPTKHGEFRVIGYRSSVTGEEHLALVMGEPAPERPVLVRVHSQCLTGDVFASARCDCGAQLETALARIAGEREGVLLYLLQEGRGIGLANKLRAYELQDAGADTVEANQQLGFPADQRDYGVGAQILRDLGVRRMRLMTNNPAKYVALEGFGLEIVERVQLEVPPTEHTRRYLEAKKRKLGHLLRMV
jgi:3,4-dihydroxy 2-butanone 4-phosphate synthase/GTP cyclohydrolase II